MELKMVGREETVKLLSSLREDDLKKFLHSCMDEICGRRGPALVDLPALTMGTLNEFIELVDIVKALCCECIAMDMDHNKLKEKYPSFSQSQCTILHSCISTRRSEISPFLNMGNLGKTDNLLSDYDWKLKWVIGSSAFSAMHEPLLALDLHLQSGKGNTTMNLELDKTELKHLIEALEKAQQSMLSRLASS